MGDERVSMPILSAYYATCRQGARRRAGIERLSTDLPVRLRPNLRDEKRPIVVSVGSLLGPSEIRIRPELEPATAAGIACASNHSSKGVI